MHPLLKHKIILEYDVLQVLVNSLSDILKS